MTRARFWITLSSALLVASYFVSANGAIGNWDIHVLGVRHGAVWDPGGSYVGSSILLFEQRYAPYVGHPGLTLMLVCHVAARIAFWMSGTHLGFQQFAGTHIRDVYLASMVATTVLWIAACVALGRVALVVLGDRRLARIAVLAFATSYPVLYYMNKVSPEPLVVTFALLAFLWLWRYY